MYNISLEDEGREICDATEIRGHVESYYKELFGAKLEGEVALGEGFWLEKGRLSDEEAQELIIPFTMKELEDALKKYGCERLTRLGRSTCGLL
jgi:hypothetical protein